MTYYHSWISGFRLEARRLFNLSNKAEMLHANRATNESDPCFEMH